MGRVAPPRFFGGWPSLWHNRAAGYGRRGFLALASTGEMCERAIRESPLQGGDGFHPDKIDIIGNKLLTNLTTCTSRIIIRRNLKTDNV